MNIAVIGSGYVGLVAGACLAESGNRVICADTDRKKIALLRRSVMPIYEAGLEDLVRLNVKEGRLRFTADAGDAVRKSAAVFIGVGTPMDASGKADLSAVHACAESIGRAMNGYKVVVIKSTVPVGTADQVRKIIRARTRRAFHVVSNPEFLKEGVAIADFMKPDRVIIGADAKKAADIMKEIYAPFIRTGAPFIVMGNRSAEMTKYASNAMLATRISFINEIANLCEKVGADISDVRAGLGADRRIGHNFLFPGIGYGGSCFPKDLNALRYTAESRGMSLELIDAAESVNEKQKTVLVSKVARRFGGKLKGVTVCLWGLAFKANTDDVRKAPSLEVISGLLKRGARIRAYDPKAMPNIRKIFGNKIRLGADQYGILKDADALLILTDWNQFRRVDTVRLKKLMRRPLIFDGRNLLTPERVRAEKIEYVSIGRP